MTTSLISLVEQLCHVSFLFKSFSSSLPSWRIKSIFLSSTLKVPGTEQISTSLFYASSFIHKRFSLYWMKLCTTSLSLKDFPKCSFVNYWESFSHPFQNVLQGDFQGLTKRQVLPCIKWYVSSLSSFLKKKIILSFISKVMHLLSKDHA